MSLAFFIPIFLAVFLNSSHLQSQVPRLFSKEASSFCQLLLTAAMALLCTEFFNPPKELDLHWSRLIGVEGGANWYLPVFLAKTIAIYLLLGLNISSPNSAWPLYLLFGLQSVYFATLIKRRPYERVIDNAGVFCC